MDGKDPITGKFLPDNPGGPGRPRGAVGEIRRIRNKLFTKPENLDKYEKALQAFLNKCPVECVDKYVPLLFPDGTDELPEDLAKLVAEQLRGMDKATVGGEPND